MGWIRTLALVDIPLDFDHPKTYIASKQIRIKALKSKLKQVKKKTKVEMGARL